MNTVVLKLGIVALILGMLAPLYCQTITVLVEETMEVEVDSLVCSLNIQISLNDQLYSFTNGKQATYDEVLTMLEQRNLQYIEDSKEVNEAPFSFRQIKLFPGSKDQLELIRDIAKEYGNLILVLKSFNIKDADAKEKVFYQQLINKARSKASRISNNLNLKLGEISNIEELPTRFKGVIHNWNEGTIQSGWTAYPPLMDPSKQSIEWSKQVVSKQLKVSFETLER